VDVVTAQGEVAGALEHDAFDAGATVATWEGEGDFHLFAPAAGVAVAGWALPSWSAGCEAPARLVNLARTDVIAIAVKATISGSMCARNRGAPLVSAVNTTVKQHNPIASPNIRLREQIRMPMNVSR
jgi:hypothetical protein